MSMHPHRIHTVQAWLCVSALLYVGAAKITRIVIAAVVPLLGSFLIPCVCLRIVRPASLIVSISHVSSHVSTVFHSPWWLVFGVGGCLFSVSSFLLVVLGSWPLPWILIILSLLPGLYLWVVPSFLLVPLGLCTCFIFWFVFFVLLTWFWCLLIFGFIFVVLVCAVWVFLHLVRVCFTFFLYFVCVFCVSFVCFVLAIWFVLGVCVCFSLVCVLGVFASDSSSGYRYALSEYTLPELL